MAWFVYEGLFPVDTSLVSGEVGTFSMSKSKFNEGSVVPAAFAFADSSSDVSRSS